MKRKRRFPWMFSALGLGFAAAAGTNDLAIARAALRDGLWDVARAHAAGVTNAATANLIVLESYAQEGRWEDVRRTLASCPQAQGPAVNYYRAVVAGDMTNAVVCLRLGGKAAQLVEADMLEADLLRRLDRREEAVRLWRGIVASTNAGERARTVAAVNLGEIAPLESVYAAVRAPAHRRLAGLALGRALLSDSARAAEGERMIRALVREAPDAEGAGEAFLALADSKIAAKRWLEADDVLHEAADIWPEVLKSFAVQERLGIVALERGKAAEALDAFSRALEAAADTEDKARLMGRRGDALRASGRTEDARAAYHAALAQYPKAAVSARLGREVRLLECVLKGCDAYREYRFDEALALFRQVAAEDAARAERMRHYEVLCLYGLGRDAEAEAKARALVSEGHEGDLRFDTTLWLAKFVYNRGEWKEAERLFNAFAAGRAQDARAPQAWLWSARAAAAYGNLAAAIAAASTLVERYPEAPERIKALLVQAEALIALARFDEAVLVLDLISVSNGVVPEDRRRALILKADALYAMGTDDASRYEAALSAYRVALLDAGVDPSVRLIVFAKIARTLEKLRRLDEAVDVAYAQVALAYRSGREAGERFSDEAQAAFSRAVLRLAEMFESRGRARQAVSVLELLAASDVPSADEARRRLAERAKKGRVL